jgi:hypothetical protein
MRKQSKFSSPEGHEKWTPVDSGVFSLGVAQVYAQSTTFGRIVFALAPRATSTVDGVAIDEVCDDLNGARTRSDGKSFMVSPFAMSRGFVRPFDGIPEGAPVGWPTSLEAITFIGPRAEAASTAYAQYLSA